MWGGSCLNYLDLGGHTNNIGPECEDALFDWGAAENQHSFVENRYKRTDNPKSDVDRWRDSLIDKVRSRRILLDI